MESKSKKLMDRLRETQRRFGHRYKTELTYASWVKRFIRFHKFTAEADMVAAPDQAIEQFLRYLQGVEVDMSRIVSPLDNVTVSDQALFR